MTPIRREYLIHKFENTKPEPGQKGKSGKFYYLLSDFHSVISELHHNGASIYNIGDAIEEAMDYKFAIKQYGPQDPFYRAIKNNIKSKIRNYPVTPKESYKAIDVPTVIKSDNVDRKDMIIDKETKNPFDQDPS
jgi:hypothetical protein